MNPKDHNAPQPSAEYQQAEQFINKAIAGMNEDNHIEYSSTIERNPQVTKLWKKCLQRLLRKFS